MKTVQSVERALTILEVLSIHYDGLGVTELSEKVNLHTSTVFRLLSTLIEKGYVMQNDDSNKYKLTFKMFELGNRKVEQIDLLSVSRYYNRKLMEKTNETVHLVVMDNCDIVYIDKIEANNTISLSSRIGSRYPLYCTASGKAILAFLPHKKIFDIWHKSNIQKLTENTTTDLGVLIEELKKVRERGYAINNEECEIGVKCIGAPIYNRNREVEGAVSISGPTNRLTDKKIKKMISEVIITAQSISKEL